MNRVPIRPRTYAVHMSLALSQALGMMAFAHS
jgi:hypothetical protein